VRDAGVWKQGVDSDHEAIFLKLEIAQNFTGLREPRLHCNDRRILENSGVRVVWQSKISNNLEVLKRSMNSESKHATKLKLIEKVVTLAATTTLSTDGRRRLGWFEAASTVLKTAIKYHRRISITQPINFN
jgi:hypothetical protein